MGPWRSVSPSASAPSVSAAPARERPRAPWQPWTKPARRQHRSDKRSTAVTDSNSSALVGVGGRRRGKKGAGRKDHRFHALSTSVAAGPTLLASPGAAVLPQHAGDAPGVAGTGAAQDRRGLHHRLGAAAGHPATDDSGGDRVVARRAPGSFRGVDGGRDPGLPAPGAGGDGAAHLHGGASGTGLPCLAVRKGAATLLRLP